MTNDSGMTMKRASVIKQRLLQYRHQYEVESYLFVNEEEATAAASSVASSSSAVAAEVTTSPRYYFWLDAFKLRIVFYKRRRHRHRRGRCTQARGHIHREEEEREGRDGGGVEGFIPLQSIAQCKQYIPGHVDDDDIDSVESKHFMIRLLDDEDSDYDGAGRSGEGEDGSCLYFESDTAALGSNWVVRVNRCLALLSPEQNVVRERKDISTSTMSSNSNSYGNISMNQIGAGVEGKTTNEAGKGSSGSAGSDSDHRSTTHDKHCSNMTRKKKKQILLLPRMPGRQAPTIPLRRPPPPPQSSSSSLTSSLIASSSSSKSGISGKSSSTSAGKAGHTSDKCEGENANAEEERAQRGCREQFTPTATLSPDSSSASLSSTCSSDSEFYYTCDDEDGDRSSDDCGARSGERKKGHSRSTKRKSKTKGRRKESKSPTFHPRLMTLSLPAREHKSNTRVRNPMHHTEHITQHTEEGKRSNTGKEGDDTSDDTAGGDNSFPFYVSPDLPSVLEPLLKCRAKEDVHLHETHTSELKKADDKDSPGGPGDQECLFEKDMDARAPSPHRSSSPFRCPTPLQSPSLSGYLDKLAPPPRFLRRRFNYHTTSPLSTPSSQSHQAQASSSSASEGRNHQSAFSRFLRKGRRKGKYSPSSSSSSFAFERWQRRWFEYDSERDAICYYKYQPMTSSSSSSSSLSSVVSLLSSSSPFLSLDKGNHLADTQPRRAGEMKGLIPVADIIEVKQLDINNQTIYETENSVADALDAGGVRFTIRHSSSRVYQLRASSPVEARQWVDYIHRLVQTRAQRMKLKQKEEKKKEGESKTCLDKIDGDRFKDNDDSAVHMQRYTFLTMMQGTISTQNQWRGHTADDSGHRSSNANLTLNRRERVGNGRERAAKHWRDCTYILAFPVCSHVSPLQVVERKELKVQVSNKATTHVSAFVSTTYTPHPPPLPSCPVLFIFDPQYQYQRQQPHNYQQEKQCPCECGCDSQGSSVEIGKEREKHASRRKRRHRSQLLFRESCKFRFRISPYSAYQTSPHNSSSPLFANNPHECSFAISDSTSKPSSSTVCLPLHPADHGYTHSRSFADMCITKKNRNTDTKKHNSVNDSIYESYCMDDHGFQRHHHCHVQSHTHTRPQHHQHFPRYHQSYKSQHRVCSPPALLAALPLSAVVASGVLCASLFTAPLSSTPTPSSSSLVSTLLSSLSSSPLSTLPCALMTLLQVSLSSSSSTPSSSSFSSSPPSSLSSFSSDHQSLEGKFHIYWMLSSLFPLPSSKPLFSVSQALAVVQARQHFNTNSPSPSSSRSLLPELSFDLQGGSCHQHHHHSRLSLNASGGNGGSVGALLVWLRWWREVQLRQLQSASKSPPASTYKSMIPSKDSQDRKSDEERFYDACFMAHMLSNKGGPSSLSELSSSSVNPPISRPLPIPPLSSLPLRPPPPPPSIASSSSSSSLFPSLSSSSSSATSHDGSSGEQAIANTLTQAEADPELAAKTEQRRRLRRSVRSLVSASQSFLSRAHQDHRHQHMHQSPICVVRLNAHALSLYYLPSASAAALTKLLAALSPCSLHSPSPALLTPWFCIDMKAIVGCRVLSSSSVLSSSASSASTSLASSSSSSYTALNIYTQLQGMRALHRPIDHVHVCSDEKTCCADDFNDDSDAKYTDGGEHGTEVTQLVLFLEDEAKADRMQRLITHHVRQSAHKCDKYKTSVAERRKEGKSRLFFIEREEDVDRENREMGIMRGKRSRNEGKEKERRLNEFAKRLQLTHLMPSVFEPKKLIENTGVGKSMVEGSRPRVGLSEQYQQVMEQVTAARLISSPASSTESRMSTPDAEHVPSVLSILGVDSLSSLSSTSSSPLSPQSSASASIMPPSLLGVLTAFPTVADSNTGAKNVTVSDADADINTDKAYGEMMEKICTDAGLDLGGFTVQAGAGVGCVERPSDTGCGSTPMDAERDDQGVDDSRRNCMPSVLSSSVFSSSSYVSPLVMDTGSFSMKLGFAQDEHVDEQNHSSLSSVSTISSPPTVFPVPPLPSVVEANQLYYPSALECDHLNIARCPSSSVMAGREFHRWRWRMRGEALQPGKEKEREQERKGEMEGSKGKGRIKSRFNSCVLPFAPYRYRYFHRNANAAGGDEGVDMDTSKLAHGITNTNAGIDIKSMDFNVDDLEVLWSKMMMRLAKQQYLPRHHRHHRRNTHTLRASANALELHLNQLGRINQLGHFEDGEPAFDYDLSPSLIGPALLATLPRNTPSKTTQEVRELLFEKFKISALHLASSTDLIAYYYGRGTCVSVDLGHSSCRVQPIVQGYSIEHAGTQSRHIGGHVLEQFIAHRLTQVPSVSSMHLTGIHSVSTQSEPSHSYAGTLSRTQEHPIALYSVNSSFSSVAASPASFRMLPLVWCARDVVQRLVYCMPSSHGYDTCIKSIAREKKAEGSTDAADVSRMGADGEKAPKHTGHRKRTYTISSSRLHSSSFSSSPSSSLSLVLGQELCEAGEILFQPRRILNDHDGLVHSLPSLIQTSIMQSPIDHRLELLSNIVLAGGGSLMPGLVARLTRELERMFPEAALARKITVHADPYRGVAAWGGGNLLSCMPSFQDRWEERWEFFERG